MDIENIVNGIMQPNDIVSFLLRHASDIGASDIHIDRIQSGGLVRFRIDGILRDFVVIPDSIYGAISVCIKIIAKLRTDIHYLPQDGRVSLFVDDRKFDYRLSSIPSHYGESFVFRILESQSLPNTLAGLGFEYDEILEIEGALNEKRGMIIVTGPTGSGKTSTLYNLLNICDRSNEVIVTLEDPIEYSIEKVRQIAIKEKYGLNFATALRSILRQDPDVIMLGEIRDTETAKIGVEASLTGHRLLTTLHTDRATDAIVRLIDMGIDPYMIASTLNTVIAQKLVRKLCSECRGLKCNACRMTGYKGRTVISEILRFSDEIKEVFLKTKNIRDVNHYLYSNGYKDMKTSAREKIEKEITDEKEVKRVFNFQNI